MGLILGPDKYGRFDRVDTSNAILNLKDGEIRITCGGQQYRSVTALTLNKDISGFGGLDTGSPAASTFYHVYAVVNGGQLGLVYSLSATAPTGFLQYKKIKGIYINYAGDFNSCLNDGDHVYASAYQASGISILHDTWTAIQYNNKEKDDFNLLYTGASWRCEVPFTTAFKLNGQIQWDIRSAYTGFSFRIYVDGVGLLPASMGYLNESNVPNTVAGRPAFAYNSARVEVLAGQYITMMGYQANSVTFNSYGVGNFVNLDFGIFKL